MEQTEKIKLTQKEFEDTYTIEEITGETEANPLPEPEIPAKQDTTPLEIYDSKKTGKIYMTPEELEHDDKLEASLNWNEEQQND